MLLKRDASSAIGLVPKVADFGLSVLLPDEATHVSNMRQGTPFYAAPEVALLGQLGPKADVFALGILLWELMSGQRVAR